MHFSSHCTAFYCRTQARMKVRSALKLMCKKCKMVKRGKKQFVICPENARHKQRQGFHTIAGVPVSSAPLDLLTNRMWTR